jgi:hypothetical protein
MQRQLAVYRVHGEHTVVPIDVENDLVFWEMI